MRNIVALVLLLAVTVAGHIQAAIRAGTVKARGVNLGSWLVIERFMMASSPIFHQISEAKRDAGEHIIVESLGRMTADPLFQAHRSNWITEADIEEIAYYGLNTVRVPVGWWIYEDPNSTEWQHFSPGGIAFLDRLVNEWAPRHNVAVLVDLHAAKGSQNGDAHSAPPVLGEMHFTDSEANLNATMETAAFLMRRYKDSEAFLGLEMLNEPMNRQARSTSTDRIKLKSYYTRLYTTLRNICADCVVVLSPLSDEQWASFGHEWATVLPAAGNNWLDWHKYLLWGFEDWDVSAIMNRGTQSIATDVSDWQASFATPIFLGEWSLAHSEKVAGALRDRNQLEQYAKRALQAMDTAKAGWTYWSWKTDRTSGNYQMGSSFYGDTWNMQSLLRSGVMSINGRPAPNSYREPWTYSAANAHASPWRWLVAASTLVLLRYL
ncbi:hypothetical protein ACHHYP_16917 [Achlya hypogyna]|uniref:glucan 1,3-beta-glucosidase n=1 Tax=Achlya hypogyna TaxID=1202772 RepID=A0A0A7CPM4_ACHHY|nr:secreted protein [Achlya hypogyna]OQR96125.1 hypothetical protein ACHHYP_16917 [Achlya hypogyna]